VDEAPAESSGPGNQSYTSPDASASEFDATDFDDITFDTVDGDQDQLDLESFDLADTPAQNNIDVSTELEEVDFYLQQGLLDDAQEACERLQKSVPDDARVEQRLEKISQFRQRHEQAAVESSGSESGKADASYVQTRAEESASLDIALPEEKAGDDEALNKLDLSLDDDFDLDLEIPELADSQRGVQTKIGDEDTESAYNLGIAYKEMGLYSDAVEQFSKSKWDPARRVSSVMLEADCYKYMQQFEKAEEILADALSAPDLQMEERIALYYETGLLYEECDRYADALASYQVVVDNKPDFREVSQKVAELKKTLGVEDDSEDLSRVSYV
jgi:tetratricopeptide (TPR) repeat protein